MKNKILAFFCILTLVTYLLCGCFLFNNPDIENSEDTGNTETPGNSDTPDDGSDSENDGNDNTPDENDPSDKDDEPYFKGRQSVFLIGRSNVTRRIYI